MLETMTIYALVISLFGLCGPARAWVHSTNPIQVARTRSDNLTINKFNVIESSGSRQSLVLKAKDENNDDNSRKLGKGVFGRIGGRKKRGVAVSSESKKAGFPWWGIPATLLSLLLFKGILNFGSDSYFVYYESTVYESRVYNNDGRLETSRKESFRSNIPGLVEQSQLKQLVPPSDDDVLQEMEQMIRRQEAFLDQFF